MTEPPTRLYPCQEPSGMWTLRQERYRGRKIEHPHDVCAIASSYDELKAICGKRWPEAFAEESRDAVKK